jgi:hypothetical protein
MEYCTESEEDKPCTMCGGCEDKCFACTQDYYEWRMEQEE